MSTRMRMINICEQCGEPFHPWAKTAKYCSRKCQGIASRRRATAICETCGKEFEYIVSSARGRFCCQQCVNLKLEFEDRKFTKSPHGYMFMSKAEHPMSNNSGMLLEHWYIFYEVAQEKDKSAIIKARQAGAILHHRNGIKHDNRVENLELWIRGHHPYGVSEKDAILILRALGYEVRKIEGWR